MTKTDEIISHLNCARNKKLQGYRNEALDEIIEAFTILMSVETPRAEERIKKRCRRMGCKTCIKEDKEDAR